MEAHEGFSIREYVSRMRSVNVVKCWPFDETMSEESVKSLLPPITVKKFIWWLDGLHYLDSESSKNVDNWKKKTTKKKVQEKGESSLRRKDAAEDSDVEVGEAFGAIKVKSSRSKAKSPKKRSILELFAVAPPVKRVSSNEEENSFQEEDGFCIRSKLSSRHEEINWGHKEKRNEKKKKEKMKKNKEIISSKLKKAKKAIDKIKNKKQKGEEKMDLPVRNKDQEKAMGFPNLSHARENENDTCDHVSIPKKNAGPRHLDAAKNAMTCNAFKLVVQSQHPRNLKRGILKNHAKAFSLQQPLECILEEAFQVNQHGKLKADKHVTFVEKDNLIRQRRKPTLQDEFLKLQPCGATDMCNAQHPGDVGKNSAIVETHGCEGVANRIEDEVNGRPISKEQLTISSCSVDTNTLMKHDNEEEHFCSSISSDRIKDGKNQQFFDIGLRETPDDPKYAFPCGFSSLPCETYYNSQNIKVIGNSSSSTGRILIKDLGISATRFPPVFFTDYLKAYNEPSVSDMHNLGKRVNKMPQASSRSTSLNKAHIVHDETFPHVSPGGLMQTSCSHPDGCQKENISAKRIHCINEDFVGLPLNSQGQLSGLSSNAKVDFNRMFKPNTMAAPSMSLTLPNNSLSICFGKHSECRSRECRISSRGQLNLFPSVGYLKEKPIVFGSSRLDMNGYQCDGKTSFDMDLKKTSNYSFHLENSPCKADNQVLKTCGQTKVPSTVRLMGKEFIVGSRGLQEFEDGGHVWKDKQIIDELHFGNTSISNVMMNDQKEPSLGKVRETSFCSPEISVNHGSRSMPAFPCLDWETSSAHHAGFVGKQINPVEKLYGFSRGTSSAVYYGESLFSKHFPSGNESQVCKLDVPAPSAAHQQPCPNASSSDIRLKKKQNPLYAPISAARFPFMHPDLDGHVQSSWTRSTHMNLSPPFFDISERGALTSDLQSHHNFCSSHHPHPTPVTNHWTDSSTPPSEETFLVNTFSFGSTPQSPVGPTSPETLLAQQAPVLSHSGVLPFSSMRKRHENRKIGERIKSRVGIRGLARGGKAKGQPSPVSNVTFSTVKVPSLGYEEGSQCDITKSTAHVNFEDVQNQGTTLESCPATNESKVLLCDACGDDQNEQRLCPWTDSYRCSEGSGPIKLAAGAKHVPKACQQIDHSSSRSVNPNIPVEATIADFFLSESENPTKATTFSRFVGNS